VRGVCPVFFVLLVIYFSSDIIFRLPVCDRSRHAFSPPRLHTMSHPWGGRFSPGFPKGNAPPPFAARGEMQWVIRPAAGLPQKPPKVYLIHRGCGGVSPRRNLKNSFPLAQARGKVAAAAAGWGCGGSAPRPPAAPLPPRRAHPTRPAFRLSKYRVMSHSPAEAGSAPGSRHWRPKTKNHRTGSFRRTLSCALFQSFRGESEGDLFQKIPLSASPASPASPNVSPRPLSARRYFQSPSRYCFTSGLFREIENVLPSRLASVRSG